MTISRFSKSVLSTKSLLKIVSSALAESEKESGFVTRLPSEFFSIVVSAVSSKSRLIDAITVSEELALYIKNELEFDQLILEFYKDNEPTSGWIHCSYSTNHNRQQSLRAQRVDGKVSYTPWLE